MPEAAAGATAAAADPAAGPAARPPLPGGPVAASAVLLALVGGLVLMLTAGFGTASVLRRWLFGQPIPGDFELVSLGSGIGVFCLLAYGSLARSNIFVDSLTGWLPARVNGAIDAFWTLVWAAVLLLLAERMAEGALDTLGSGTTTMVLGLSTWWAVAIGAVCLLAAALASLAGLPGLLRARR